MWLLQNNTDLRLMLSLGESSVLFWALKTHDQITLDLRKQINVTQFSHVKPMYAFESSEFNELFFPQCIWEFNVLLRACLAGL